MGHGIFNRKSLSSTLKSARRFVFWYEIVMMMRTIMIVDDDENFKNYDC